MKKYRIFIVDDNEAFLDLFNSLQEARQFDIHSFCRAQDALDELGRTPADLIISDVEMPGMSGIDLFHKIHDLTPSVPMILITAYGSTEQAVNAVQQGAFHYFEKPLSDKLPLFWTTVREALAKGDMLRQLAIAKKKSLIKKKSAATLIGRSAPIREVFKSIQMVAELPATVLLSGETGTGKGLAAQLIHQQSGRLSDAFFAVSCSEFAPGVLESELFGHERGAFTGAVDQRKGFFEMADQGTLFLDEISDAPASLQAKLLRVLETKQMTRVGGTIALNSDFRLLAATNQNLETCVANGSFRSDLLYRIKVYEIELPPLRQRKEDISLLAEYYLNHFNQAYNRTIKGFSEAALQSLRSYEWPGNVRELINVVERAVIICLEENITTGHLPFERSTKEVKISNLNLTEMEKFYMELALKRTTGNKTQAARLLGVSRKTLIDKVKKYRLE